MTVRSAIAEGDQVAMGSRLDGSPPDATVPSPKHTTRRYWRATSTGFSRNTSGIMPFRLAIFGRSNVAM